MKMKLENPMHVVVVWFQVTLQPNVTIKNYHQTFCKINASNTTNNHLIKTAKLNQKSYQFHNWLGFLSASDSSRYPMGKSCHLCGKQFRDVWFLKQHLRIHTGAKPFACLICGHRANRKSNMTQHIRTVHRDVPEAETVSFLYEATDMPEPPGHPQWYDRALYYHWECHRD